MKTFAEFNKFKERVQHSYRSLESHREQRLTLIKQFIGDAYGPEAADGSPDTLINMLELLVKTLLQQLGSGTPRCMVTTDKFQFKTNASYFQMALNHVATKIDLRTSLQGFITEAIFSMGMMKIGVTREGDDYASGFLHDPYLPFADPIYFDDLVYDTSVPFWELIAFVGNHYRLDIEDIRSDPANDPTAVKEIGAGETRWDTMAGDRAEDLSGDDKPGFGDDEDRKKVDLWDVWLPRKGVILTYAESGGDRPLRTTEWDGPDAGPYRRLVFNPVLNNIQPVPPISTIAGLSELLNLIWNKIGEQESRRKTVGFCHPQNMADGTRVILASDGEIIPVKNPQAVGNMKFGGADQASLAVAAMVADNCSRQGGNINTLAGLSSDANTLGQQELMSNSSNAAIRSMQQALLISVREIFHDIGWHIWNDPLVDLHLMGKITGTDVEFQTRWPIQVDEFGEEQDLRQGQYNDLNFQIDPFSMKDQTPEGKLMQLRQIWQQDIVPMIPLMQASGKMVDVGAYLKKVGELANMSDCTDELIIDAAMPVDQQAPPSLDAPPKPANTTRTYERVRGKGPSSGGMDRAIAMAGMGSKESGA